MKKFMYKKIILGAIIIIALAVGGYFLVKHEREQSRKIAIMDEFLTITFRDQVIQYIKLKRGEKPSPTQAPVVAPAPLPINPATK